MGYKLKDAENRTFEIPDREFYFNTKVRGRRMMQNSLSSDARRVYACLELATMGFSQELAVKMDGGEKVPYTPADIRKDSGLLKQNVNRGLVELEDEGLVLRKSDDGGPLRNGHMLLYSFAVPREPKEQKGNRARVPFPACFPDSWETIKLYITRHKYSVSADLVLERESLEEGERVVREYQKAEEGLAHFVKGLCAPRPYKEERKERTKPERTAAAASLSSPEPAAAATPPPLSQSVPFVAEELDIDQTAARQIVTDSTRKNPSVTTEEIVEVGRIKSQELSRQQGVRSRTAILKTYVPEMCAEGSGTLRQVRANLERVKQEKQEYESRRARAREAWPDLTEMERIEVQLKYPGIEEEVGVSP